MIRDPEPTNRLQAAVDDLDVTIKQIRSTIFALGTSVSTPTTGTRDKILAVVAEASRTLDSEPQVHLDGPIGTALSDQQADELLAALRELLTDVARHARARYVRVAVVATDEELVLTVEDDGAGPPPAGTPRLDRQLAGAPRALRLSCE